MQGRADELQGELDGLLSELYGNQAQINAGVKELEGLIVRRFEDMQKRDEEEHGANQSDEFSGLLNDKTHDAAEDAAFAGLDPVARRRERKRRLVAEQRKRIENEEAEKREADEKIRALQGELARLVEANNRLTHKLHSCEHNTEEAKDAIEDMEFQITQNKAQKENTLAVLSGEVTYLKEHQMTVLRKASELKTKMADVEGAISANSHKLQRTLHATELATADKRRDLEHLEQETKEVEVKFEALRDDVRVLYQDKVQLRRQLGAAKTEAADVEACVSQYRRSIANMIDA